MVSRKKKSFTLIEIILAITGFFLLMVIVMNAFLGIVKLRYNFQARAQLIENSYYAMEKLNLILRNYTIDYEEYFNRWHVGCNSGYQ
jgi:Tfp pilus assembly protein PilE